MGGMRNTDIIIVPYRTGQEYYGYDVTQMLEI